MVALHKRVDPDRRLIEQLKYWRGIRLDYPWRKAEALHHIDNLLNELLAEKEKASNGA